MIKKILGKATMKHSDKIKKYYDDYIEQTIPHKHRNYDDYIDNYIEYINRWNYRFDYIEQLKAPHKKETWYERLLWTIAGGVYLLNLYNAVAGFPLFFM
jgi:hypothetical protein